MTQRMTRRSMTGLIMGGAAAVSGVTGIAQLAARPAEASAGTHAMHGVRAIAVSTGQEELRTQLRKLWADHVFWTRLYIISAVDGLADADVAAKRLLGNQDDIGNAVRPVYGDAAADRLTSLLRDHITGAAALLTAAKSGDQSATEKASTAWYANADQIADFLASANPDHWPQADLRAGMTMHLDQTLTEAKARMSGDYAADVLAFDEIFKHMMDFSDLLANGIVAQFPDKFA